MLGRDVSGVLDAVGVIVPSLLGMVSDSDICSVGRAFLSLLGAILDQDVRTGLLHEYCCHYPPFGYGGNDLDLQPGLGATVQRSYTRCILVH
jgi:hypothetical protein